MLTISLTDDFSQLSYSCSIGERKQGVVQRLYNSFRMAKEWQSKRKASWVEEVLESFPHNLQVHIQVRIYDELKKWKNRCTHPLQRVTKPHTNKQ